MLELREMRFTAPFVWCCARSTWTSKYYIIIYWSQSWNSKVGILWVHAVMDPIRWGRVPPLFRQWEYNMPCRPTFVSLGFAINWFHAKLSPHILQQNRAHACSPRASSNSGAPQRSSELRRCSTTRLSTMVLKITQKHWRNTSYL